LISYRVGIIIGFMKQTFEITLDVMIWVLRLMTIRLGIQIILILISEQYERLQCWMTGIYKRRHWDDLKWHDIRSQFHRDHFRCLEVVKEGCLLSQNREMKLNYFSF
jgi:hypothetical protein